MYDNGFSDRLIRAAMPTEKKNRETREKDLQSVYEKCRQSNVGSFGEYIRSKISRETLRKCGISNIDLRYIDLSSESQLYHGGTSWEAGKMYLFTGSIDRLSNSNDIAKHQADDFGVECVRLFQLDKDRHLLAVNRNAIQELCREWYDFAFPPDKSESKQLATPIITINGHDGTNGNMIREETEEDEKENTNTAKEESDNNNLNDIKKETNTVGNGKKSNAAKTDEKEEDLHQTPTENGGKPGVNQVRSSESKPDLFERHEGLSLIDICFLNERETEFYNVEGIAYEDASSSSSKDILLYHTSASASISSKDILLFDTTNLRLKQELIVPRRSTKHLVRGQNGYLKCNEPARPRAPPSVRARPISTGSRNHSDLATKSSWSAETSTRDTKL